MKAYHEAISDIIPNVIRKLFTERTLAVIATGRTFYSATTIMQHIRFHTDIVINDPDAHYKINNNWTPVLAREFMAAHPEHNKFFKTRNQARVPQSFYSSDFAEAEERVVAHVDFETRSAKPMAELLGEYHDGILEEMSHITPAEPKQAPLPNCYVHPPKSVSNADRLARSFCQSLTTENV